MVCGLDHFGSQPFILMAISTFCTKAVSIHTMDQYGLGASYE